MRRAVPYLMLMGAALFWAGNFTTARALRDAWPPLPLNAVRWLVALAVLLPFTWGSLRAHAGTLRREVPWLAALALTGVVLFQTFLYQALASTTVVTAALIAANTPLAIALGARWVYGERLTRRRALGIAVAFAGALVVVARGDLGLLLALRLTPGDLWMLAAVPCWAAYSLLLKRTPAGLPQGTVVVATSALGALMLLPLAAWRIAAGDAVTLSPASVAGALYIGVFAGALAFVFWNRGVAAVGATRAGLFLHLMPLFAALLGVTFLGERLATHHLAGGALVMTGLLLASVRGRTSD
jgi:drug/metabolite transporter (DMT)-like permease